MTKNSAHCTIFSKKREREFSEKSGLARGGETWYNPRQFFVLFHLPANPKPGDGFAHAPKGARSADPGRKFFAMPKVSSIPDPKRVKRLPGAAVRRGGAETRDPGETPYTPEELRERLADRKFKNTLAYMTAHNLLLIEQAQLWRDFKFREREICPTYDLAIHLSPGKDVSVNNACNLFNTLRLLLRRYGEGGVPKIDDVVDAERTAVTLVEILKEIRVTAHLHEANLKLLRIFSLMRGEARGTRDPEDYNREVDALCDGFVADCKAYSAELDVYLGELKEARREEKYAERRRAEEIAKAAAPATAEDVRNAAEKVVAHTAAAVNKAQSGILKDTRELKEICDPAREARRSNARRKRKNRPSGVKEEFIKAALDEIDAHPNSSKRRCCYCVFLRWQKNRPDDVAKTYPKFQTFNSIVARRLTSQKSIV